MAFPASGIRGGFLPAPRNQPFQAIRADGGVTLGPFPPRQQWSRVGEGGDKGPPQGTVTRALPSRATTWPRRSTSFRARCAITASARLSPSTRTRSAKQPSASP